jgi:hypothetical protein
MSGDASRGPVQPAGGVVLVTPPGSRSGLRGRRDILTAIVCLVGALSGCAPGNDVTSDAVASQLSAPAPATPGGTADAAAELRCPLSDDHRGVRVLIFTRSDCPIANRYAPRIRDLCATYEDQGVQFSLVYPDPRETESSMQAHLAEYNLPCRGFLDPEHRLVAAVRAEVTPEAVVYDRTGRQVYRGRIDDRFVDFGRMRSEPASDDLRRALDASLTDQPVRAAVTKAIGCPISDLK